MRFKKESLIIVKCNVGCFDYCEKCILPSGKRVVCKVHHWIFMRGKGHYSCDACPCLVEDHEVTIGPFALEKAGPREEFLYRMYGVMEIE